MLLCLRLLMIFAHRERSPDLPSGLLNWFGAFFKISDTYVLNHSSLDGYLFLRYLKIATAMCFVGCCITFPILFPVNATGGGGKQQLDLISFSNVSKHNRYYAHVFVAWVYLGERSQGRDFLIVIETNVQFRFHHVHGCSREHLLHQSAPGVLSLTTLW